MQDISIRSPLKWNREAHRRKMQGEHLKAGHVLLTGGAGFIGSATASHLSTLGGKVSAIDVVGSSSLHIRGVDTYKQSDITDERALLDACTSLQPEVVVHLAALVNARESFEKQEEYARVNVQGTKNVVQACLQSGVKKLVFISSCAVYGEPVRLPVEETHECNPLTPYGKQKSEAERIVEQAQARGLQTSILRLANVYGPGQKTGSESGVVALFCEAALKKTTPTIYGDGLQTRDFVFVDDVAQAIAEAIDGPQGTFNIGTGVPTSIRQVLATIQEASATAIEPKYAPVSLSEVRHIYLDVRKAAEQIGWTPTTSFAQGIEKTLSAMK